MSEIKQVSLNHRRKTLKKIKNKKCSICLLVFQSLLLSKTTKLSFKLLVRRFTIVSGTESFLI